MGRIPSEVIEQVRIRADIVEVIQSYIPLKKLGRDFKACCPFHQEKTPSFTVNVERQWFHCFGCGKHGNAIGFVMERENVDFVNAIQILARKYNIYIPEEPLYQSRTGGGQTSAPSFPGGSKERLYVLYEKLQAFYAARLKEHAESAVAKYLETRLLPPDVIERFGLGASPEEWDGALNYARKAGFTDEELVTGGIVIPPREGEQRRLFDRFRNRLMFPIWNEQGRVVAFSARAVEKEFTGGKYVNSPETPLFRKSRILYALHFARVDIGVKKFAILCEGQLDVIAMHRAGFQNAVAPQGTAFTQEQAVILKRYTDSLYLATDSDKAGTAALFKDASIAFPLGFEVKVIRFPGGKDPDELLKKEGAEAIAEAVNSARDFFDFAYEYYTEEHSDSPAGKAKTADLLLDYIRLLESETAQSAYLEWLSSKNGMSRESLTHQLSRLIAKNNRAEFYHHTPELVPPPVPEKRYTRSELQYRKALQTIFEVIVRNERAAEIAVHELSGDLLDGTSCSMAIEEVIQSKMLDEWSEAPGRILARFTEHSADTALSAFLMAEHDAVSDTVATTTMNDCIRVVRQFRYARLVAEKKARFAALPPGDPERKRLAVEMLELARSRALSFGGKTGLVPVETPKPEETV